MIETSGVVERLVDGDAYVRVSERVGGCGRCDEPGGCRSSGLTYPFKAPGSVFRLPNRIGARPGDAVTLRMQEGGALRGALMAYGLGVVCLLGGAAVGRLVAATPESDLPVLAGSVVGLLLAVAINRIAARSGTLRAGLRVEMAPAQPHAHCGSI